VRRGLIWFEIRELRKHCDNPGWCVITEREKKEACEIKKNWGQPAPCHFLRGKTKTKFHSLFGWVDCGTRIYNIRTNKRQGCSLKYPF